MNTVRKVKEVVRNFIDIIIKDAKKLAISSIAIGVVSGAILFLFVHRGIISSDMLYQIIVFQISAFQIVAFLISLVGGLIISFYLTPQFSWRIFYFILSAILIYYSIVLTLLFFAGWRFHSLERERRRM